MGLSSAQARLLTITARKSDCEFQSMSLSHQKLALSRDMESITDEYQNALNATKLVYDFYGTGGSQMALNYSLLMTPSVYNDFSPRFVTDATNRVILNPELANVARACGIPMEGYGGTNSDDMRAAFIQALANEGILSASEVASIENVAYDNAAGLGYGVVTDEAIEYLTYEDLISQLKSTGINDMNDYGLYLGDFYTLYSNGEENWRLLSSRDNTKFGDAGWNLEEYKTGNNKTTTSVYSTDGGNAATGIYVKRSGDTNGYKYETTTTPCYVSDLGKYYLNGNTYAKYNGRDNNYDYFNNPITTPIKFTDLLTGEDQYTFAIDSKNGVVTDAAYMQRLMCGDDNGDTKSVLGWMTDQLLSVLGETDLNIQALDYARGCILDLIWPDNSIQNAATSYPTSSEVKHDGDKYVKNASGKDCYNETSGNKWNDTVSQAENVLGFYTNTSSGISINLNNIAKVFMTSFVDYIQGMENTNYAYGPMKKSNATLFNSKTDTNVVFEQLVGYTTDTGADTTLANFYDTMFNIICTQGWTENGRIDDADYMQEMMKNGMVYMSTIGHDGTYGQSNYTTDKYVLEVADEEAITRAEAKYKAAKARIENKENTLDLKMKSLDTEISSLNQEYETAKTLIKNAVDKSFTRYQA